MATLDELLAERERRAAGQARELEANTAFGAKVLAAQSPEALLDGVPLDEALADSPAADIGRASDAGLAKTRLQELLDEKARRAAAGPPVDGRINTSPLPTGVPEIDRAGERVPLKVTGPLGLGRSRTFPALEDLPYDSPVRMMAAQAAAGVDFQNGASFIQRLNVAILPQNRDARAAGMQRVLGQAFTQIPDDMPKFRYDPMLDSFQIMRPQKDGSFRWTAMDGSGLEVGDIADMANLAEIGSLIGSVLGAGKYLTFWKGVGRTGLGGLVGRELGEATSIAINYLNSGFVPTRESLIRQGWSDVGLEALTALLGELGAKVIRGTSNQVQATVAEIQGKQGVENLSAKQVDEANLNIRETRQDMVRIKAATGEELNVTIGSASRSLDILETEAFNLKNATKKVQRAHSKADAENRVTVSNYIDEVYAGNKAFLGDIEGTVRRADDLLGTAGHLTIAQTDNGIIHIVPKIQPKGGIKLADEPDYWQIRGFKKIPKALRGLGLGRRMYEGASAEARRHGKVLASDTQVSEEVLEAIWKKLEGKGDFENLIWNKNVEWFPPRRLTKAGNEVVDSIRRQLRSTDGLPVVQQQPLPDVTSRLLKEFQVVAQGADGKFVANKEMQRFLRKGLPEERAVVLADIKDNPIARHQMKQAIFADYERVTRRFNRTTNKQEFDLKAFEQWKEEVGKFAEQVFTPSEMRALRTPGNFRGIMQSAEAQMTAQLDQMQRIIPDITRLQLLDPSQKPLWNQIKKLAPKDRRRMMRILDASSGGNGIRELFKDELRLSLHQKAKGSASESFDAWFAQNSDMILDMTGDTVYVNALRSIQHILRQRSDRAMISAAGGALNPNGIALTRVIFGPLSRIQRGISALSRTANSVGAAQIGDIITNPAMVKELMSIRAFPVASRRVAQVILKMGLLEVFGLDPDTFNADDADDRELLARRVSAMVAADVQNVEQ